MFLTHRIIINVVGREHKLHRCFDIEKHWLLATAAVSLDVERYRFFSSRSLRGGPFLIYSENWDERMWEHIHWISPSLITSLCQKVSRTGFPP